MKHNFSLLNRLHNVGPWNVRNDNGRDVLLHMDTGDLPDVRKTPLWDDHRHHPKIVNANWPHFTGANKMNAARFPVNVITFTSAELVAKLVACYCKSWPQKFPFLDPTHRRLTTFDINFTTISQQQLFLMGLLLRSFCLIYHWQLPRIRSV